MMKHRLTMSSEFLEIMKIESMCNLFTGISYRDIREELDRSEYRYTNDQTKKSHFRSFPDLMDYIEERFGTLPKMLYWVSLFLDDMDTEDGAYPYMFLNTYLMTEECQDVEYFNLDLLKKYGEELCDFISNFNPDYYKLKSHFEKVRIKLDRRMVITHKDPEHKDMVERLKETLVAAHDDEMNYQGAPVNIEESNFSGIVFTNPLDTEIQNMQELRELGIELSQIFSDLNIKLVLQNELKILAEKFFNTPTIELCVCMDTKHETKSDTFYFSDFDGHPRYIAEDFKKSLERFLKSDKKRMFVETSSIYIFNIIRQYVISEKVELLNNEFNYEDSTGQRHKFGFGENYWVDPLFAKDFLDVAYIGKIDHE